MTQPSDPDDFQWFDAVAGKLDPSARPEVSREGTALRGALQERAKLIDKGVPKADSPMYERLVKRLEREGLRKRTQTFSWKALLLYVMSAFAVGAAVTRVMFLPNIPATRATTSIVEMLGAPVQQVVIRVADPTQTTAAAVAAAVTLSLAVAVESDPSGYRVLIDGFVPYSPDQEALRTLLGLDKSASGRLLFLVTKRVVQ